MKNANKAEQQLESLLVKAETHFTKGGATDAPVIARACALAVKLSQEKEAARRLEMTEEEIRSLAAVETKPASQQQDAVSEVDVQKIKVDAALQSRASIDQEIVGEYAEAYKSGEDMPHIFVFFDGQIHWLADGFHRLPAAILAGKKTILAIVRAGTRRDAILFSAGANSSHGLRRSNEDKRHTIQMLLADSKWSQWTDREIARQCRVSHPLVAQVRSLTGNFSSERTYNTKHGSTATMDTTRIGRKPGENVRGETAVNLVLGKKTGDAGPDAASKVGANGDQISGDKKPSDTTNQLPTKLVKKTNDGAVTVVTVSSTPPVTDGKCILSPQGWRNEWTALGDDDGTFEHLKKGLLLLLGTAESVPIPRSDSALAPVGAAKKSVAEAAPAPTSADIENWPSPSQEHPPQPKSKRKRRQRPAPTLAERIAVAKSRRLRRTQREKLLGAVLSQKVRVAIDFVSQARPLHALQTARGFAFAFKSGMAPSIPSRLEGPELEDKDYPFVQHRDENGIHFEERKVPPETPERCWIAVYSRAVMLSQWEIVAGGIEDKDADECFNLMAEIITLGADDEGRPIQPAKDLVSPEAVEITTSAALTEQIPPTPRCLVQRCMHHNLRYAAIHHHAGG